MIQTDYGAEFQGQFHWHVLDKGINHVYVKPRSPRLNGKVERSHRIDKEEFHRILNGVAIDDAKLFNEKLQEWEDFYNYNRPHAALGGKTRLYLRCPLHYRVRPDLRKSYGCGRSYC